MTRHVSAERLTRFRDGDLRRQAARRVRRHLAGCSRCRETEAAVAAVPDLLAAVQAPPLPVHLAARIETALAAESAHRADESAAPRGRADPVSRPPARRRPAIPAPARRVLTVTAVIVVIVVGGIELVSHLGGGSAQTSSASSGATGSGAGSHAAPNGAARPTAQAPVNGIALPYRRDGRLVTITPARTATNYQPGQLVAQVQATLARTAHARARPKGITPQFQGTSAAQATRLAGCVNRVAAGANVLLVDVARFRGRPATIIVTAAPGSGTQGAATRAGARVWVVGSRCSGTRGDVLAQQRLRG